LRQSIVVAIGQFIGWLISLENSAQVPSTSSSISAFDVNQSITRYIVENTHVYRKTGWKAKICEANRKLWQRPPFVVPK